MQPTLRNTRRQRGVALIITVGLLAVLAVIGFGFAVLARLHHDISSAYRASAQNDLIAHAALQYAIGEIRYGWGHAPVGAALNYRTFQTGAIADPTDGPNDPWFVDPTIASQGYPDSTGRRHYCNLRCNSYALVHDDLGARVGVSNIKVFDCAGKLNLNDREDTDSTRLKTVLEFVLEKLDLNPSLAAEIIADRGVGFSTLEELRTKVVDGSGDPLIGARTFELLKHCATIYSWPHQLPVADSFPYVVYPAASALARKNSDQSTQKYYYRSPINVNTASRELLYALLRTVLATDGTQLTAAEAYDVALWMARKRDPESTDHWDTGTPMDAAWKAWLPTGGNAHYDESIERSFDAWRNYPMGPFDDWNEVIDFLYSLAPRSGAHPHDGDGKSDDPFPDSVLTASPDKKAEAILAALSPNTFASGLAAYNTGHLSYSRLKKDSTGEQIPRDWDFAATTPEPQVIGKHQLAVGTYPLCFSSLGRHEIYSRTYTFLKAQSGTSTCDGTTTFLNALTDTGKTWLSSPSQWRGYSVLIYEGKGKGQVRGIVYVRDDGTSTADGKGHTLVVDRWSDIPDSTSRYYIVGPGALLDRVPTTGQTITTDPVEVVAGRDKYFTLYDSEATWENDQWNGHRVLIYRSEVSGTTETVDEASIQERTIIDTFKGGGAKSGTLLLAPDLDPTLMDLGNSTKRTCYIILGCDGMVEHGGALKAYDVVHHTTQDDFEDGRPGTPSDAQYTYAASGPNYYRKADGSLAGGGTVRSLIDGWLAARRKLAAAPPGATNPLVHNFIKANLDPDEGGSYVASNPPLVGIVGDCLESTSGRLLSDGLRLSGELAHYVDFRLTNDLCTDERHEGGFVGFWFRPDEAFFSGTRALVKIYGETTTEEVIALLVKDGAAGKRVLELKVISTTTRNYEVALTDSNHLPTIPTPVKYKSHTSTHQDGTYSDDVTDWKPGEWHHIAFAWFECANDDENYNADIEYNSDSNPGTDWRDDDQEGGVGKPPNYILDDEVACRLRIWVDGSSSDVTKPDNEKPAFNFVNAAGVPMVRLSGEAAGTIDGLVVYPHIDKQLVFNFTVPARYDGFTTVDAAKYAEYQSASISLPANPGQDLLTLGTVAWTGFLPWIKEADRWGGPGGATNKFPVRVQAALGGTWSTVIPENATTATEKHPVFGGGALLNGNNYITTKSMSPSLQYRVFLLPRQGVGSTEDPPGLRQGRQTPVVEDVTVTVLGPVVFYFWQ
ncbi:MAG TPA: hypothetical protein VNE39_25050 [Planctomycetota bacterium]|nr:hypothetical protein [Planctomycetota bacterium]